MSHRVFLICFLSSKLVCSAPASCLSMKVVNLKHCFLVLYCLLFQCYFLAAVDDLIWVNILMMVIRLITVNLIFVEFTVYRNHAIAMINASHEQ